MYLRIVLRSQPVNLLMAWMLIPCRCSSFSSCTSIPLNKSRYLRRVEWAPVYHVKGWGKFNRHYGDFCTGADTPLVCAAKQRTCAILKSLRCNTYKKRGQRDSHACLSLMKVASQ